MLKKNQKMKSQNTYQNIFIALLVLLFSFAESKAQYFSSDYFTPIKISGQPRTNNSFFYASYGLYNTISLDYHDIVDIIAKPYEKDFTLAWFKNKSGSSKAGFEMIFNHRKIKTEGYRTVNDIFVESITNETDKYFLQISTVGDKGVAWSIKGVRSIYNDIYGHWGFGAEMRVGGHPYLTQKKHKWPLSWAIGTEQTYQQKPPDLEKDEWVALKEENSITASETKLYSKVSFQHFAYKKRVGWYLRMDIGGSYRIYNYYNGFGGFGDVSGIYLSTGLATGLMF